MAGFDISSVERSCSAIRELVHQYVMFYYEDLTSNINHQDTVSK